MIKYPKYLEFPGLNLSVEPLPFSTIYQVSASGMPIIKGANIIPENLIHYQTRIKIKEGENYCIHGFLDDRHLNPMWTQPKSALKVVKKIGIAITPDFSLNEEWPDPINRWNIYRTRWVGAFWESHGIKVIPSVNWADSQSFEYCFDGLPKNGILAITTNLVDDDSDKIFWDGFYEMLVRLNPKRLLVYGKYLKQIESFVLTKRYSNTTYNLQENGRSRR